MLLHTQELYLFIVDNFLLDNDRPDACAVQRMVVVYISIYTCTW